MKKFLTLTLLTLLTCSVYAVQIPATKITNILITEKDKTVTVSFDVVVDNLNSNYELRLALTLSHGSQSQSLMPIVVRGRTKSIMDKRAGKTSRGQLIGKQKRVIPYRATVGYENWMNEVSLKMTAEIEGCCKKPKLLTTLSLVNNKMIYYDIEPASDTKIIEPKLSQLQQLDNISPFLYPASDYDQCYDIFEKQREKGSLVVHFQQGYSSIDPSYMNNKQTLGQINKVLDLIDADTNATLKKIVIIGLASPEGSLVKNDLLAEARANSLKYFLGERVKYDPNLFEIINGSEDWDGLKTLVENSRMSGRWQVLEIIDKYSVSGGRELELMKLNAGEPYRYMMEYFFPKLRNAGYVQMYYDYDVKPDLEAEKIQSAIQLFNNKQYDQALPLLLSAQGDNQLENIIGVCYMMIGDYALATTYFEKAIAAHRKDAPDAAKNLEQIRIKQSIK